jgi:glycine cleavage system H protein
MKPESMRFSKEHEWAAVEPGSREATVGITDYAAGELGDIVYVELPEVGTEVKAMEPMGTIEAVKTVADLYSPLTGKVVAVNEALADRPELVNQSPYEEGWMVKIEMSDPAELDRLMSYEEYQKMVGRG